jgi:hypothetical protein
MRLSGFVLAVGLLFALALPVPAFGQQEGAQQPTDPTVAVIRMKVGSAVEAASILDELFNGSGTARKTRIVVIAIPLTNCLFVGATKDDLATIRALLRPL